MPIEFKGDERAHSHIDWRHGSEPAAPSAEKPQSKAKPAVKSKSKAKE